MKANVKKICAVLMVLLILALTACQEPYGVKKTVPNESESHIAYYYTRRGDDGREYCMSLLKADEELNTEAEPNVYISDEEFDFEWDTDVLAVFLNDETIIKDPIEIDGILIAYGYLS